MPDSVRLGILKNVETRLNTGRPGGVPAAVRNWSVDALVPSCLVYPTDDPATRGTAGIPGTDKATVDALMNPTPISLHILWFTVEFRLAPALTQLDDAMDACYQWAVKALEGQIPTGGAGELAEVHSQFRIEARDQTYLGLFMTFGALYTHAVGDATTP